MDLLLDDSKVVERKLAIYGYEKGQTPLVYNGELASILMQLNNLSENKPVKGFQCSKVEIFSKTQEILNNKFVLKKVLYLPSGHLIDIINKQGKICSNSQLREIIGAIKRESKWISPFDLPIIFQKGHSMVGEIQKPLVLIDDEHFLKNYPISFDHITLGNNLTKLSSATYGHEIVHTQFEGTKGACLNYHNKEILPIFMEKLMALEIDPSGELLKISEKMRFRHLADCLRVLEHSDKNSVSFLVDASVYVNSTLKATHLFDKYIYGDTNTKTAMLAGIQEVFDGKSTVEEFLEKQDVGLENSTDLSLIKRHLH